MKKTKSATSAQQPPESPLSSKVLSEVGPLQVIMKLMLESEIEQLEEYYCDQKMSRNLALAVSIRKQTLADGPGPEDVSKKKRRIGRYDTHLIHTTQHPLYNTHNDVEFTRARSGMDGQQLYRALHIHITEM